jgi:phosphoribosylformylglycinamidine cyclo-ligase
VLRRLGRIPDDDYRRTFNLGIGMILVVSKRNLSRARKLLDGLGEASYEIGRVVPLKRGAASRVIYV